LAIVAATIANGGVNPLSGEQVYSPATVQNILSLMNCCGMYDYSGEFAFKIGMPAKSGVGGGIIMIVPGVMGICTFSPPLDSYGNSARGVQFATEIS
jgi:glutaminase